MLHYSDSELNIAKLFVCGSLVGNCPKPKTARIAPCVKYLHDFLRTSLEMINQVANETSP